MPTENEVKVLRLLSAIEIPPNAGEIIQGWGVEAVTIACDAALGNYPALRPKVRTNAAAVVGTMSHPQAKEAVRLLLKEANTDVCVRALRAASRQKREDIVPDIGDLLDSAALPAVVAAEAVKALVAIDSSAARSKLQAYMAKSAAAAPHRGSPVVQAVMKRLGL
jgi:hypothetical protein